VSNYAQAEPKATNYPVRLSSTRQCAALKLNRSAAMKTYLLYIHDDRYTVPTMDSITVIDDERAKQLARERLASSAHYHTAELWEDERLVARLENPGIADPA